MTSSDSSHRTLSENSLKVLSALFRDVSKTQLCFAALVLAGYLVVTFTNLRAFPPYFFCDEAVAGIDAWSMLHTWKDHRGQPWPIFFHGLGEYALSLTVYLQIPLVALLGLDEIAVRSRAALMSVVGMVSVSYFFFLMRGGARIWLVPAGLASSVFWYLHSRTGFEYIDATACYFAGVAALLIACSFEKRRGAVAAGILFGLCFYAYTPARGWTLSLLAALALLAFVDKRLSKRMFFRVAVVCMVVLLPLLWLHYAHPEIAMQRFQAIRGERIYTLPVRTVVLTTVKNYADALNPYNWFFKTENLHPRHSLPGFALIPSWMCILWFIGLGNLLFGWRRLPNRVLLACILTTPMTAALFEISTARCLPVGVGYVLLCALGADVVLCRLPRIVSLLSGVVMCAYAGCFFVYTQTKAIYSYPFYGMYGIQYGARQLYTWVQERMGIDSDIRIINSTFNSGDVFPYFYLTPEQRDRVRIIEPLHICLGREDWNDSTLFIFPALWFETSPANVCPPFERELVHVIKDPKGQPLFEAMRIKHSPAVMEWWETQEKERLKLQADRLKVNGMDILFEHSKIAWGSIEGFFDGDSGTRARTDEINPGIFTVRFATTAMEEVGVRLDNTTLAEVLVEVLHGEKWERIGERSFSHDRGDPMLLMFKNPLGPIDGVRFTVSLPNGGQRASVHLADILLKREPSTGTD